MVNTRKTMNDMVPARSIRNISKDDIAPSSSGSSIRIGHTARVRKEAGKVAHTTLGAKRAVKTVQKIQTVPAPAVKRVSTRGTKIIKEDKSTRDQKQTVEEQNFDILNNQNQFKSSPISQNDNSSISLPTAVTTPFRMKGGNIYKDMTPVDMYSAPVVKNDSYLPKESYESSSTNTQTYSDLSTDSSNSPSTNGGKKRRISIWVSIIGSIGIILTILIVLLTNISSAKVAITPKHAEYPVDTIITSKIQPSSSIELPYSYISVYTTSTTTVQGIPGDFVQKKAKGSVMVFNNSSTGQQTLVAGTRLQSKKGLIYRLVTGVTIPAKKGTGAQAVPGSATVEIIADQPGDIYNLYVSELNGEFSIPAFKGTTRAGVVYARQKTNITGGSVGRDIVIDSKTASSTEIVLRNNVEKNLKELLLKNVPEAYTGYENMISIYTGPLTKTLSSTQATTKANSNTEGTTANKATISDPNLLLVTIEGRAVLPIFKTQTLIEKILAKDSNKYPFGVFSVENISSVTPTIISNPLTATSVSFTGAIANVVNFPATTSVASGSATNTGTGSKTAKNEKPKSEKPLIFKVKDTLHLSGIVPLDKVREKLLGTAVSSSNTVFINFPGISSADVSITPFWIHTFPTNPQKLHVELKK